MVTGPFSALVVGQAGARAKFVDLELEDIDEGEVTIEVAWSSLNYKDALAITARAPIVRRFPVVCGVDLVGRVIASSVASIAKGESVIVTGCGLGETRDGGYARYARVPAAYCVALPEGLGARRAMGLGTAGLTAMLAVQALETGGCLPESSRTLPVLVTGAAGGVGSIAVALLSALGYEVVASTGRRAERSYLERLGAMQVIARAELSGSPPALGHERFSAAIDVVGGNTIANVVAATRANGVVASCGHAGGAEISMTVYPFILRGVSLIGINSVWPPATRRTAAWRRLAATIPFDLLDELMVTEPLEHVPALCELLLTGDIRGRIAVAVNAEEREGS